MKTKRYCGYIDPDEYESIANKLTLRFKSDNSFQETGFKIKITTKASTRLPPGKSFMLNVICIDVRVAGVVSAIGYAPKTALVVNHDQFTAR